MHMGAGNGLRYCNGRQQNKGNCSQKLGTIHLHFVLPETFRRNFSLSELIRTLFIPKRGKESVNPSKVL
jgi:hypothetical protein